MGGVKSGALVFVVIIIVVDSSRAKHLLLNNLLTSTPVEHGFKSRRFAWKVSKVVLSRDVLLICLIPPVQNTYFWINVWRPPP